MNISEENGKSRMGLGPLMDEATYQERMRRQQQQEVKASVFRKATGDFPGFNIFSNSSSSSSNNKQHRDEKENSLRFNIGLSKVANQQSSSGASNSLKELTNNRTTDAQTMMHILKANIGTGVLAMPNAFKNVGLWLGFLLIPVIGCICIHCMNILIASHNHLCDRFNYESLDYDQVAALGLACGPKFARRIAKYAHVIVTVFLLFTQIGFCCVYIMFVVENIQLAILNLFNVQYSTTTYLMLAFPLIGLTSCTSNLKHLARISTLANVLQLSGLALIFYDLLQFHTYSGEQQQSTNQTLSSSSTTSGNNINVKVNQLISEDIYDGLPLFFATAVYAFEGIGVVLPLIKEMEEPARISGWNGVLNTGMSGVALLYMGMGFFGYAKYGHLVQGSITLNLPQTTLNEIVRVIFALAIGLSYSLQFYVPWTIMWPFIDESLFYSYRPRETRDKLDILSKLSAANEWAFQAEDLQASQASRCEISTIEGEGEGGAAKLQVSSGEATSARFEEQEQYDGNSAASTFATSYAVSSYMPASSNITGSLGAQAHLRARRANLFGSQVSELSYAIGAAGTTAAAATSCQYGSITMPQAFAKSQQQQQFLEVNQKLKVKNGREINGVRDRLEDVREQDQDGDSIPEVEWRPPPRSMRGKRKLVRYTVILVIVSFTFVAAALIPRLDLFIALIGALASSCLAIIFPAIIQLCTFWSTHEDDHEDEADDDDQESRMSEYQVQLQVQNDENSRSGGSIGKMGARRRNSRGSWRKSLAWYLFAVKNLLLVIFGILGLITGSWISLAQLTASYMAISDTLEQS